MTPVITVGLPVARETEAYVEQAIRSVLNQSFGDWELVIVADGSTPAMVRFLRTFTDPRIRVLTHETSAGLAARLNEIASVARGEFLARFDADDIMIPTRLAHQLKVLHDSGADVISGRAVIIDESGTPVAATPAVTERVPVESMFASTPLIHPTVFARTEWFRAHPYDASLLRCQDKALWITSAVDSIFFRDAERVLFYRVASDLDPLKYARSARFERVIVRRLGPAIIGRRATLAVTARGWIKEKIVRFASMIGRGDAVMRRRYSPLSPEDSRSWRETLQRSIARNAATQSHNEEKP